MKDRHHRWKSYLATCFTVDELFDLLEREASAGMPKWKIQMARLRLAEIGATVT